MKLRAGLMFILGAVLVIAGVHVTAAAPRPAILVFESSLASVTIAEAESGDTVTTLSWRTTGITEEYRLQLLTYRLDRWEQVFDPLGVPLEPNGAHEVIVRHPLNFGPPTYLLSIVQNSNNSIVDQRVVTIPYVETAGDGGAVVPAIDVFAADVENVAAADLQSGTARVMLTWELADRITTAQPVFEQIFADGSAQSVELPRTYLWIPSVSQGPVAPVYRVGEDTITLRLRLLDLVSGDLYDEATIELAVTGTVTQPDTNNPVPTATPLPAQSSNVLAFTATPNKVNPGQAITLSWEVVGTVGVLIDQNVPNVNASTLVVSATQSPKGTATVYLPDYAFYGVTYVLRTVDGTATAQVSVEINCPYTFFFGMSGNDDCPTGEARQIQASYQEFENGIMVWRSDTNEIYVQYVEEGDGGTARIFLETSYAGLPEVRLSEVPPLDRVAPVAGFGKVWANVPEVRARLGWALSPEEGYTMMVQDVAQTKTPPPLARTYYTLPRLGSAAFGIGPDLWFPVQN